ncbi:hypothetical protein Ancab_038081, partial [Ancistrocladus abbreviatus]
TIDVLENGQAFYGVDNDLVGRRLKTILDYAILPVILGKPSLRASLDLRGGFKDNLRGDFGDDRGGDDGNVLLNKEQSLKERERK